MPVAEYIDVPAYVVLVVLGVLLCFWGRQFARVLSSIAFAAFLGYTSFVYSFKLWGSLAVSIPLAFIAALIGLFTGFLIYKLALSVVFAYIIASTLIRGGGALFIVLVIVLTVIVYMLGNYVVSALFALTGATMIYRGVVTLGLNEVMALVLCTVVFILGVYNQVRAKT
ncbi:MAG: hypothetical protein QXG48_01215 [Thermofilaceae archaeon]